MGMMRPAHSVRRVVTGNDADGRSCVLLDSEAPARHVRPNGTHFVELWTFDSSPAPLSGDRDESDRTLSHSPPAEGAHFRIVQIPPDSQSKIDVQTAAANFKAMNSNTLSEHVGGERHWNMHRTPTVDYGIVLEGEYVHVLPDRDIVMRRGDIVVQLAHVHSWSNQTERTGALAFVMIGGEDSRQAGSGS